VRTGHNTRAQHEGITGSLFYTTCTDNKQVNNDKFSGTTLMHILIVLNTPHYLPFKIKGNLHIVHKHVTPT